MASITFLPDQIRATFRAGETVFEVAQRADVAVQTSCVGKGTCGLCRVRIVDGAESLSAYNEAEEKHLGNVYYLTHVRLSCQAIFVAEGDVTVELAPKRKGRKNSKP